MLQKLNEVLGLFSAQSPELTGPELVERLQRPRSTVYRLLRAFEAEGFLDYDARSARYRIGIRLAALGALAQRSTPLQRSLHPVLARLARDAGESATLMIRSGSVATTIEFVDAPQALIVPGVLGGHPPLHASAGGKVLLAWLPEAERRALLGPTLQRYTPATITDVDALMTELDAVRATGLAMAHEEWVADVHGMAAPVWDHTGALVAAITIGFPSVRAGEARQPQLEALVRRSAEEGSMVLGARPRVATGGGTTSVAAIPSAPRDRRRRARD